MPLFTRISSSIGYVFVLCTVMASGQTMSVKIVRRQNSETGYTYQVSGHLRSTSNEDANCNANSDEDSTHVSCHGSGTTNTTITAPQTISYSVTGATYSLLLPDGRVAVVNCESKSDNGLNATMANMSAGWDSATDGSSGRRPIRRSCRTPLVDDVLVEFKGKNAKLKWPVSIDGKKFESETFKILGVLYSTVKQDAFLAPAPVAAAKPDVFPSIDAILDKFIKASGGKAVIESINSDVSTGTIDINGGTFPFEFDQQSPDKWRIEVKLPDDKLYLQFSNGIKEWEHDPEQGLKEMSSGKMQELTRDGDLQSAIHLKKYYPKMELKGKDKVGDRPVYIIEASSAQGHPKVLYFDTETGLQLREDSTKDTKHGTVSQSTYMEDYKDFQGGMVAYTIRQVNNGQIVTMKIGEIKRNIPIDDKRFEKPE